MPSNRSNWTISRIRKRWVEYQILWYELLRQKTKNTHCNRTTFHSILSGKLELEWRTILHWKQWQNEAKCRPRAPICRPLSSSRKPPFFTSIFWFIFFARHFFFAAPWRIFATPWRIFAAPIIFCPSAVAKSDGFVLLYNFLSVDRR